MIKPEIRYPANSAPNNASYPHGSAVNSTAPGAKNGYPWEKDQINDWFGFFQKLVIDSGVTISGIPDTVLNSDMFEALIKTIQTSMSISTVAALQAFESDDINDGSALILIFESDFGIYVLDKTDITSTDNSGDIRTLIVDSDGGRWFRRSDALISEPYLGLSIVNENFRDKLLTSFNWNIAIDNDAGSALTLGWDEDLGRMSKIDLGLLDVTCNDGTPVAVTEIIDEFNCDNFRIKAVFDGDDADVEVHTQQLLDFNAAGSILSAGQSVTPFAGFVIGSQAYVRVKKGIGQGRFGVNYQMQDPKTKARSIIQVWIIDLDDGESVRDYDLLLPQCSASTMAGQVKLGDTTSLTWQFKSISGSVEILGYGINPQAGAVQQIYKETVLAADLPTTKEWYSPWFSRYKFNRIRFFVKQKLPAETTTASRVRMEVSL